jgi:hypothetical protein
VQFGAAYSGGKAVKVKLVAWAAMTMLAPASLAHATGIDFTTLTLNGNASATPANLKLVNGTGSQASSAFITTPISSASTLTSTFSFSLVGNGFDPQADGLTFIIQAKGVNALGEVGRYVGAGGSSPIAPSIGIAFQSWYNNHATIFKNGDVSNGTQPNGNFLLGGNLKNNVNVSLQYFDGLLSYIATNTSTGQTISDRLAFDLSTLGPNVFLGFTGGSATSYSFEDVQNWGVTVTPQRQ